MPNRRLHLHRTLDRLRVDRVLIRRLPRLSTCLRLLARRPAGGRFSRSRAVSLHLLLKRSQVDVQVLDVAVDKLIRFDREGDIMLPMFSEFFVHLEEAVWRRGRRVGGQGGKVAVRLLVNQTLQSVTLCVAVTDHCEVVLQFLRQVLQGVQQRFAGACSRHCGS